MGKVDRRYVTFDLKRRTEENEPLQGRLINVLTIQKYKCILNTGYNEHEKIEHYPA